MADPVYSGDFFLDAGFTVKQEPISMDTTNNCTTASMPIPPRKMMDLSEFRDFGFDFVDMASSSPSTSQLDMMGQANNMGLHQGSYQALWGQRLNTDMDMAAAGNRSDTFRMDEDDIFQVDKADLIQGPTLAELNANDENLLEDLNFDDLLLPEENSFYINVPPTQPAALQATSITNNNTTSSNPAGFYKDTMSPLDQFKALSPGSRHSSSSSLLLHSAASTPPPLGVSPLQQRHSTLHELLLKKEAFCDRQMLGQSVPGPASPIAAGGARVGTRGLATGSVGTRLSSSAPTHLGLEQIWQRREPRQHLLSTGSLVEAESTSSLSTGGVLSPESHDFSHDEGFDSEDDSDHYEDFSSDAESTMSDGEAGPSSAKLASMSKKERYFWQYNVQAKGPKGQRLVLKTQLEDPHVLNEVTDPVFSPQCSVRGIKHSGKARKGDGNDLTPNPRKLCSIGKELDKLSRVINDMTPVSELPFNVRPKTRKEKNKLASRACRLKKKAQHEANKMKLYGLEHEHKRLNTGIAQLKQILAAKFSTENPENQEELSKHMDKAVKSATKVKIAGYTTEFVNKILDRVKSGVPGGGLDSL